MHLFFMSATKFSRFFVRCSLKRNERTPAGEYDYERIASKSGVATHGDFCIKGTLPLMTKRLRRSPPQPLPFQTEGRTGYGEQDEAHHYEGGGE